jgi:hypothetical protein
MGLEGTPRTVADQYLGLGERAFALICAGAFQSKYFEKST